MKKLLDELLKQLHISKSPLIDLLQNGVTKASAEPLIKKYEINFPEELFDLYSWKNGIGRSEQRIYKLGELYLFNLGIFRSINESLEIYQRCSGQFWANELFPVFESGGGDYYLVCCKEGTFSFGKVYFFSPSSPDFQGIISIFDDLETLVETVIECYANNVYYFESDSPFLQINDALERDIAIRINPGSDYWKIFS